MITPVRVLSVALGLWLTAASAFPTCCWTMALPAPVSAATSGPPAHHHEPIAADQHAHHQAHQVQAALAPNGAKDCAAEGTVALVPTGTVHSFKWIRVVDQDVPLQGLLLHSADRTLPPPVYTPPGTSDPDSAFLSPLRI